MKHHIIVKFTDAVTDKPALTERIAELYSAWTQYPFLTGCELIPNCVDRANRYDLMIVLTLPESDLPLWDGCELHGEWKRVFGQFVASKAIFDSNGR